MTSFNHVRQLKSDSGFASPDVSVVERDGRKMLMKDYDACPARHLFARYMARRERRIMQRLNGIGGVPEHARLVNGSLFLRSFIPGGHLKTHDPGDLPNAFYRQLERLVNRMHKRNVVHLDLRHLKNIVVSDDLQPYIVDFETAVDLSCVSFLPSVQDLLKWVDRSALLRIKNRYFKHLFTEDDRQTVKQFYRWRRLWIFSPFKLRDKDRV